MCDMRMANDFGKRRTDIIAFLKALSDREKLVALTYLSNDPMIRTRIPNMATTVLDMHRSLNRQEILQSTRTDFVSLDLTFLAQRKGCRLQRAAGRPERWWIYGPSKSAPHGRGIDYGGALTPAQALEVLRSLPDQAHPVGT